MKYNTALSGLCVISSCFSAQAVRKTDDVLDLEFGRTASQGPRGRELHEVETYFRELLDEDYMFLSMSMSMSMSMPTTPHAPTPSPSVGDSGDSPTDMPATTDVPADLSAPVSVIQDAFSSQAGCDEQVQTVVNLGLEVETAIGRAGFTKEIGDALEDALKGEYSFCSSPRSSGRQLDEVSFLIGDITVEEEDGSCTPQIDLADECHYARADFTVSGGGGMDVGGLIEASVKRILSDDRTFDDQLMMDGIVDVRLKDDTPENGAELTPRATTPDQGSPATTAIVAIAATGAIVLAAFAFRRSRRKGKYAGLDDKGGSVGGTESHADTAPGTVAGSSAMAI